MAMDRQRRSTIVIVSLVGVAGGIGVAAAAFPGTEMRRNLYNDRAACERDYTPQQCQPAPAGSTSFTYISYRGPEYIANRGAAPAGDPGPGRTGVHASVVSSVRGGFGGFAHSAHAGS